MYGFIQGTVISVTENSFLKRETNEEIKYRRLFLLQGSSQAPEELAVTQELANIVPLATPCILCVELSGRRPRAVKVYDLSKLPPWLRDMSAAFTPDGLLA